MIRHASDKQCDCQQNAEYTCQKQKTQHLQFFLYTQLKTSDEPAASELPVQWLESQALFLLELMMQQCRTEYELGKLLQLFAATDNLLDGKYSFFCQVIALL